MARLIRNKQQMFQMFSKLWFWTWSLAFIDQITDGNDDPCSTEFYSGIWWHDHEWIRFSWQPCPNIWSWFYIRTCKGTWHGDAVIRVQRQMTMLQKNKISVSDCKTYLDELNCFIVTKKPNNKFFNSLTHSSKEIQFIQVKIKETDQNWLFLKKQI